MTAKQTITRDAFTLSHGAATLRSPMGFVPQVSSDRINAAIAKRLEPLPENQPDTGEEMLTFWGRFWVRALRKAA